MIIFTLLQCSLYERNSPNEIHESKTVHQFVGQYQTKMEEKEVFPCYRNSGDPHILVETIKYSCKFAFHSFLWPLRFMSISFVMYCVIRIIVKRREFHEKRTMKPDILLDLEKSMDDKTDL